MTTGKIIRKNLGLEKVKNARISRAIGSSTKILFIFYDSYRKTMPVTIYRIRRFPWVATMWVGTELKRGKSHATFTPPMDLDSYNGTLTNAMVIPVNLAGDRFIRADQFSKKFESVDADIPKIEDNGLFIGKELFKEFVTIADLKDKGNMSDFTATWRADRNRVMGNEAKTAKLVDCFIDEADRSATFAFLTESTELGKKAPNDDIGSIYKYYGGPKGEIDPENNFKVDRNSSKLYELQLKVLDFTAWLDVFEGEKIGKKEMKEILEVSNVQLFSTSPSFHWQGANVNLTKMDGSIHGTSIPNPVWGPRHGDPSGYFIDKHLYGLLQSMPFFLNQMAQMLMRKLKQRGLI